MQIRNSYLWIFAIIITLTSAVYQRLTGPTYPIRGKINLEDSIIRFKFARTHGETSDHKVSITIEDSSVTASLHYKRFKSLDNWTCVPMQREGEKLTGFLPHQPPAGKLEYKVMVSKGGKNVCMNGDKSVTIRFKGKVPLWVLIPHVIFIFLAMLFSNRAGLEAVFSRRNPQFYVIWTVGLLFLGGMILGPVVQKFAFGEFWTGFPFGTDLTDNKTAIAMVAWIAAAIAGKDGKSARGWIILAALVLLLIYLIPHSLLGSELDYSQMPQTKLP